jgi:DMSO/TMAO reductase YedYZ heme-binding membrane subunit/ferredoxin
MGNQQAGVHLVAATVGFIALCLLWLAVLCGIALRNGWTGNRVRHATVQSVHRGVSMLGLTLGAVHAFAQLAAPGGGVRLVDEFVPFANDADPVGIGFGVVGLEVLTALALSVFAQRRMGYGRWRALHMFAYAAFMLVVAHVLISGSDVGSPWVSGAILFGWLSTVGLWFGTTRWAVDARQRVADRFAARQRVQELTVNVDSGRCARFGFCEHEAPDVFVLRSDGRLSHRALVPAPDIPAVVRAAQACPTRAITVGRIQTHFVLHPAEERT